MLASTLRRMAARRAAPVAMRARSLFTRAAAAAAKPSMAQQAVRAAAAAPSRPMSSEAKADDALVAEAPKGGLLGRGYDLYPVVGLGLAAAITQEWWIFDEYWITGGCYFGVLYTAYVLGFDSLQAARKDGFAKRVAQTKAAFGIRLDMLKRYEALEQFSLSHADELRNLYAEEAKINQMSVDYQNLKHKNDVRNSILQKLNSIKVLEDDARRQAISALSAKAGEYVAQAFASAPAAVKQKKVEEGISAIAPELTTKSIALQRAKPAAALPSDDPVKMLFDEFLATPRTFEQLGVENYVVKFMERRKAEAAKKH